MHKRSNNLPKALQPRLTTYQGLQLVSTFLTGNEIGSRLGVPWQKKRRQAFVEIEGLEELGCVFVALPQAHSEPVPLVREGPPHHKVVAVEVQGVQEEGPIALVRAALFVRVVHDFKDVEFVGNGIIVLLTIHQEGCEYLHAQRTTPELLRSASADRVAVEPIRHAGNHPLPRIVARVAQLECTQQLRHRERHHGHEAGDV
mmetsp:Transcript_8515/g.19890  ORF Transcript_8515/g.19890 Transcript_8515/m.19890 type:complete len:201 (+) Transcript_8515:86-688(+)